MRAQDSVADTARKNRVKDWAAPEAAIALWAFLYGMTALEAAGVFGERKPAGSLGFRLQMWINAASKS